MKNIKVIGDMNKTLIIALCISCLASCSGDKPPTDTSEDNASETATAPNQEIAKPEQSPIENKTEASSETDVVATEPQTQIPESKPVLTKPAQEAAPPPASATPQQNDMLALAKKSGCMACHTVDKKIVGPAWKDVAKRYAGNAGAREQLIEKVSKGGKGNWTDVVGTAAMPPYHPRVTKENIGKLVDFVLSLPH
jgi:cytochrome c551/c552